MKDPLPLLGNELTEMSLVVQRVLEALKRSPKTNMDVAREIGCSQPYISQLRNGKRTPGAMLIPLCNVLGLDANTGLPIEDAKNNELIHHRIRQRLNEDKRNQEEIARLVGCSQGFISNIKIGKRSPSGRFYRSLCNVLGLDANTGLPLTALAQKRVALVTQFIAKNGNNVDSEGACEIPEGYVLEKVSEDERAAIETLRTVSQCHNDKNQSLNLATNPMTVDQRDLILAVIAQDYLAAMRILTRLIESQFAE